MTDPACIFCKIARGEIPAGRVYEDEHVIVFRDITPKAPVHLLAIPRIHVAAVHEVPAGGMDIMAKLFAAVREVVVQEKLAPAGYRLVINAGEQAGQTVPHVHIHILSGRPMTWPPG